MDHEEFISAAHDQVIHPSSPDLQRQTSGSSILSVTSSNPDFHPMEPDYHYPYHTHQEQDKLTKAKLKIKAEEGSKVTPGDSKVVVGDARPMVSGQCHDEVVYLIP